MCITTMLFSVVLVLLGMLQTSRGFMRIPLLQRSNDYTRQRKRRTTTSQSMLSIDQQGMDLEVFNPISTPVVEAEMLSGVSHATLDFPTLVFAATAITPSKQTLRLFAVIGRLSLIFADYIPDHSIRPEELGVQLLMVAITMKDMFKTARSSVTSSVTEG